MYRVRGAGKWLASEASLLVRSLLWLPLWLLVLGMLAAIVALYQAPRDYSVQVGTPQDQAYVRNFHARLDDPGRPYRWSDVYGYVDFPGLGGSRPFTLSVALDPGRPAPVTLIVNGVQVLQRGFQSGWQTVTLHIDEKSPAALASRDTVLEIRAPDYRTEDAPAEPKGVKAGAVRVEQARAGGFIEPPYARLLYFVIALVLVYLTGWRAVSGFASPRRARLIGLSLAALAALGILMWVATDHVAVSAAALHIVATLLSVLLFLVLVDRLARNSKVPPVVSRLLAVAVALGFGLRFGGMGLPQSVITDMPWHMKWLRTLLAGDWQSLYFPGGLSSVPREWGLDLLIPKSPLFYFAAAPFSLLPFDLETLVEWLVCLIDASVIWIVFRLTLRAGAGYGAATWAAGLYAIMPLAFRAFSYGILPTIFAQWLSALVLLWALSLSGRPARLLPWLAWTLLACLALLAFPTVAVFLSLVLLGALLAWWLGARRRGAGGSRFGRFPVALVAAWLLAIWTYYGLYISPLVTSAQALLTPKAGQTSTVRWPGGLPDLLAWTADYVVSVLPALLAALGLALLFSGGGVRSQESRARWLVLAWAMIAPVFLLANLRMDMIGKHLFFTMAPFAVAGGVLLYALSRRGRASALLASLVFAVIAWQGLIFWVDRLVRTSS